MPARPQYQTKESIKSSRLKNYSWRSTLIPTFVASLAIAGLMTGFSAGGIGGHFFSPHPVADYLSKDQKQERQHKYEASDSFSLALVSQNDMGKAVATMQLTSPALESLIADLYPHVRTDDLASRPIPATSASDPADNPKVAQPVVNPDPKSLHRQPLRLAWITLWDTDTEDGDAVQIVSQGYSRTVVLTKQPMIFAVPVPADGVVNVVGVRDGEGGGITVGLASGANEVVFPIMSEGQTLGLKVKVD